jgi:hypothetical protein
MMPQEQWRSLDNGEAPRIPRCQCAASSTQYSTQGDSQAAQKRRCVRRSARAAGFLTAELWLWR